MFNMLFMLNIFLLYRVLYSLQLLQKSLQFIWDIIWPNIPRENITQHFHFKVYIITFLYCQEMNFFPASLRTPARLSNYWLEFFLKYPPALIRSAAWWWRANQRLSRHLFTDSKCARMMLSWNKHGHTCGGKPCLHGTTKIILSNHSAMYNCKGIGSIYAIYGLSTLAYIWTVLLFCFPWS